MNSQYYTMDPLTYEVVPCSLEELSAMTQQQRVLASTQLADGTEIITQFWGINQDHDKSGPPKVFETSVHGGPFDGASFTYTNRNSAVTGHRCVVEEVRRQSVWVNFEKDPARK